VAISYRRSIVTKSLSLAIFEIRGTKPIWVTTLTFHVTIGLAMDRFLLVVLCTKVCL